MTTAYHPLTNRQRWRYNKTPLSRFLLYVAHNQRNWVILAQQLTYACNYLSHRSTNVFPYSLTFKHHSPVPVTIYSPTVLATVDSTAIMPKVLRSRLLAQLAAMSRRVSRIFRQNNRLYKHFFYRKFGPYPSFLLDSLSTSIALHSSV